MKRSMGLTTIGGVLFSLALNVVAEGPAVIFSDDFKDAKLKDGWVWAPSPTGETSYSLTDNPGFLTLINKSGGGMDGIKETAPKLYRQLGLEDVVITVKLSGYKPKQEWEEAGLYLRQDDKNRFKLQKAFDGKEEQLNCAGYIDGKPKEFRRPKYEAGDVWFRITREGGNYLFSYSNNGNFFSFIGVVSAEAYTTPQVGFFASNWEFPQPNIVKFGPFEIAKPVPATP